MTIKRHKYFYLFGFHIIPLNTSLAINFIDSPSERKIKGHHL